MTVIPAPPVQKQRRSWIFSQAAVLSLFYAFILGLAVWVAVGNPGLITFKPLTAAAFVQTMAPLLIVSLFIERTIEVFVTTWRGPSADQLALHVRSAAVPHGGPGQPSQQLLDLAAYRSQTQRIAFTAGVVIGTGIAALGVRALGALVDPGAFASLSQAHASQASVFVAADVLLTGAVLGGGSDGIHKIVSVFTNFLDATSDKVKTQNS